jgi:hypothetical protein
MSRLDRNKKKPKQKQKPVPEQPASAGNKPTGSPRAPTGKKGR